MCGRDICRVTASVLSHAAVISAVEAQATLPHMRDRYQSHSASVKPGARGHDTYGDPRQRSRVYRAASSLKHVVEVSRVLQAQGGARSSCHPRGERQSGPRNVQRRRRRHREKRSFSSSHRPRSKGSWSPCRSPWPRRSSSRWPGCCCRARCGPSPSLPSTHL